jgi:predicted ester cyclase
MSIGVIDIFRMEKDKLVEHWGLSDTMSMMQQLGGMPVPE